MIIPPGTVIGADGVRATPPVPTDASLYNHYIGDAVEGGTSLPEGIFVQDDEPAAADSNLYWTTTTDPAVSGWDGDLWQLMDPPPPAPMGSAYQTAVLADDPLGCWMLDETSGTVATDRSGHGLHGTYHGSPDLASSVLQSLVAPTFDGVDDYVELPVVALTDANHFTLEIVAERTGPNATAMLFSRAYVPENLLLGYFSTSGEFGMTALVGPNFAKVAPFAADTPFHLVAVYTNGGEGIVLWVNGVELSARDTGPPTAVSTGWNIGAHTDASFPSPWDGACAGAALYDFSLSPTRIAAHYAALTA